ncbi:MAG: hypothetical protein Q8P59_14780, partial [Dehalococcoidia bacterium]|nr:hypothetical protein [Dehalococcoidia bacterium]
AWLRLAELAATPERAAIYYRRASAVDPRSLRAQKGLAENQAIPQPLADQNKPEHIPAYPKEERAAPFRPVPVNPLAFPPDAPIFVDNEVAPFTLELDKTLGSKNISFTQSNRSVGDRIEKGPDDQPPVEAISS